MVIGTLTVDLQHEEARHTITVQSGSHGVTATISRAQVQSFAAQLAGELDRWPVEHGAINK